MELATKEEMVAWCDGGPPNTTARLDAVSHGPCVRCGGNGVVLWKNSVVDQLGRPIKDYPTKLTALCLGCSALAFLLGQGHPGRSG